MVGFHHAKAAVFLERAMNLFDNINQKEVHLRNDLLDGVSVYYMSESKSQKEIGWVDKAHCLNQFFTEELLSETTNWENLSSAITYQYNVAGKVHRIAGLTSLISRSISDKHHVQRALMFTAEQMMYQFHDSMLDNVHLIRTEIEDRMDDYKLWYAEEGKKMMLNTERKKKPVDSIIGNHWMVPKLDAFVKGENNVQYNYNNPSYFIEGVKLNVPMKQHSKRIKEIKIREHAIKVLIEDLTDAYKSMNGDELQTAF